MAARALFSTLIVACFAGGPGAAIACPPPVDGKLSLPSPEKKAAALLEASDAVYVAYLISEVDAPDGGVLRRLNAHFRIGAPLRGKAQASLYVYESTCGSPFVQGRPAGPGQPLLVLAKEGRLLAAYKESSAQAEAVRRLLSGRRPPAPQR
jgi:hypothetical protein